MSLGVNVKLNTIMVQQRDLVKSITINGGAICYHGKPIIEAIDNKLHFPNASNLSVSANYVYCGDTFKKVAVEIKLVVTRDDLNKEAVMVPGSERNEI